jgi:hypothetical protein
VIDTHCHLLAGVDDGPRTEPESLRLARRLVEEGVTTVLCTPHFSDQFATPVLVARERHGRLRAELGIVGIELETHLAAELSVSRALMTPPARLGARSFGGRYVLVELVRDTSRGSAHSASFPCWRTRSVAPRYRRIPGGSTRRRLQARLSRWSRPAFRDGLETTSGRPRGTSSRAAWPISSQATRTAPQPPAHNLRPWPR